MWPLRGAFRQRVKKKNEISAMGTQAGCRQSAISLFDINEKLNQATMHDNSNTSTFPVHSPGANITFDGKGNITVRFNAGAVHFRFFQLNQVLPF